MLATCVATPGFGSHTVIAAAVERARDRELVVARRGAQRVLAHGDVAEVAAEVVERQRQAGQHLVRDAGVERQLIRTLQVRIELRQRAHAEVRRQAGEVDLAADRRIAGAATLAIGDVVAVDVGPRAAAAW